MNTPYLKEVCFVHKLGDLLYPVKSLNLDTGRRTYRYSEGGIDGNVKYKKVKETESDEEIADKAERGYSIRCRTANGSRDGMFKRGGRSVIAFKRSRK